MQHKVLVSLSLPLWVTVLKGTAVPWGKGIDSAECRWRQLSLHERCRRAQSLARLFWDRVCSWRRGVIPVANARAAAVCYLEIFVWDWGLLVHVVLCLHWPALPLLSDVPSLTLRSSRGRPEKLEDDLCAPQGLQDALALRRAGGAGGWHLLHL